jgi:hypothetical protein
MMELLVLYFPAGPGSDAVQVPTTGEGNCAGTSVSVVGSKKQVVGALSSHRQMSAKQEKTSCHDPVIVPASHLSTPCHRPEQQRDKLSSGLISSFEDANWQAVF